MREVGQERRQRGIEHRVDEDENGHEQHEPAHPAHATAAATPDGGSIRRLGRPTNEQMPAARFVLLLVMIAVLSAALAVRERPANAGPPPPAPAALR